MSKLRVGLVGCGRISDIYLKNLANFKEVSVTACASLDINETRLKAEQYNIAKIFSVEEIMADPDIDCILNLTIPAAHAEITLQALNNGKHVYSEKPFVTQLKDGLAILEKAREKSLTVGNAPDTFLGGRWQTCRKLIDEGIIGRPIGVTAFVGTHGVERHHPNPDFYYHKGGGPLLDLGPYYLTAMVFLLGSIVAVNGMGSSAFSQRMIENGPRHGEKIDVEVDTHSQSMLVFENGALGSMTISFDIWDSEMPRFEIYGEEGTICIADPDPVHGANIFEGDVLFRTKEMSRWSHQPRPTDRGDWRVADNLFGYNFNARGLGLLDMACGLVEGRTPRASAELSFHVSEIMEAISNSCKTGKQEKVKSRCDRPEPLPFIFP